ncbi:MAG: DUF1830 domain-containing protein [Scytolyngbya sp. HA4215-MV1]|jgi:hypothetical protein|nr:DUF1830 domain-containing protein [Scytolyngbya sp. HA4215-MV1]
MTYLLSLLTAESPAKESNQALCYYINHTDNTQIIRAMRGAKCQFERIVFSKERILFESPLESYLEVYSCLINSTQSSKIDCKSLHVHENLDPAKTHC